MGVVKVVGLDHIVFRCADTEKSLAFYTDTLGLVPERVTEWRAGEAPFPSVRITPTTIIDLFGGGGGSDTSPGVANVDHVCLVIEPADLDALAPQFPNAQRADHLFGAQGYASSLYIKDPDGNTIELRSYAS
jgi:catechol 2,3-dioxygenase-like lactoylglutathione lyase family enzyme